MESNQGQGVLILVLIFGVLAIIMTYVSYLLKKERKEEELRKAEIRKKNVLEHLASLKARLNDALNELSAAKKRLEKTLLKFGLDLKGRDMNIYQFQFRSKHIKALHEIGHEDNFYSRQDIIETINKVEEEHKTIYTLKQKSDRRRTELAQFQEENPDY